MATSTRPEPPREAALIEAARKRARLSVREAARQAGLSDARWRQITSGYQSVSGSHIPVKAPADTLARMAQVLHITAEELVEVGREDAAKALRDITPIPEVTPAGGYSPPIDAVYEILAALPPEAQDEVIRRLRRPANPPVAEPNLSKDRRAG